MCVLKLDVRYARRTSHQEPAMSAGDSSVRIMELGSERLHIVMTVNQERSKSDDCALGNG